MKRPSNFDKAQWLSNRKQIMEIKIKKYTSSKTASAVYTIAPCN